MLQIQNFGVIRNTSSLIIYEVSRHEFMNLHKWFDIAKFCKRQNFLI